MNEYYFPIVCGRWDNGGLVLCINSCTYARMYVYLCICIHIRWCACMYVCTSGDWRITLSMSKRKQNSWFVVRKYLLFTGKLDFCSCLICLIRSHGTAG